MTAVGMCLLSALAGAVVGAASWEAAFRPRRSGTIYGHWLGRTCWVRLSGRWRCCLVVAVYGDGAIAVRRWSHVCGRYSVRVPARRVPQIVRWEDPEGGQR